MSGDNRVKVTKTRVIKSHHQLYKLLESHVFGGDELTAFKDNMAVYYSCFCLSDKEHKALDIYKNLNKLDELEIKELKISLKCDYIAVYLNNKYLFKI